MRNERENDSEAGLDCIGLVFGEVRKEIAVDLCEVTDPLKVQRQLSKKRIECLIDVFGSRWLKGGWRV